jgi:hypothetical protein
MYFIPKPRALPETTAPKASAKLRRRVYLQTQIALA